jgi:hypothetical protein
VSARLLALAALAFVAGCSGGSGSSSSPAPAAPPPTPVPPTFDAVSLPTYPPLGPGGKIDVKLTDAEGLSRITATFKDVVRRSLSGTTGSVSFLATELGEGMGTLTLVACDVRSNCRQRTVTDLLVDLTPPDIELERPVVSSLTDGVDGQVAVWVTDGWVLGSVALSFAGKTLHADFPKAYPATLGTSRDVSRVAFPAKEFPDGAGMVTVVATDAAGNARTQSFALRIDGSRPTVAITEPQQGAKISGGRLTVQLTASDEGGSVPVVDLWIGGARVLAGASPATPLVIDTSSLPPGPVVVRAIATDQAGNESTAAEATIEIMP